jgi:hypothetical protein
MNTSTSSIPEMINSSIAVLTKPSISTFEQYERRGTARDALIYVALAAAIAGLVAFVFNIFNPVGALVDLIGTVLTSVIGFFVFAYILFFVGKQQGGTGTQDEVFYTCALYTAPLLAIVSGVSAIPVLGFCLLPITFLLGLYQLFLGFLATRSSMNLDQTKAIITVIAAIVGQLIVGVIIAIVLGSISGAVAR